MDKGRIIDNIQNTGARFIDSFGSSGKTSVKTTNPPGGKSSFSLGWEEPTQKRTTKTETKKNDVFTSKKKVQNEEYNDYNDNNNYQEDYSNKVSYNNKNYSNYSNNSNTNNYNISSNTDNKTSVKVKYPSGGRSQIVFGNDNTNMNDYKKNN
jgi:hypothetical protein